MSKTNETKKQSRGKNTAIVENIDVKKLASDIIALATDETATATVETVETTATATDETETATVETATVENRTFTDFENLYSDLCGCDTKHKLVDTMNMYGLRTTTQPTDTPNKNDLYIQFFDKSRVLIGAKSLKLYTCDTIATTTYFDGFVFDKVNDGSYRTNRATVSKSVENFTKILRYFTEIIDGCENSFLPTK